MDEIYGLLSDEEILKRCGPWEEMIEQCVKEQRGSPSYGLGSYGYDIRLGNHFLIPAEDTVLDPTSTSPNAWQQVYYDSDSVLMPPGAVWLAESVEYFNMPDDVMGLCLGKSSYARCGLLVNATPLEPGWRGRLTLELKNLNHDKWIRLYIGQGIAQVLFFRGATPPKRNYATKEAGGAYQNQDGATPAKSPKFPQIPPKLSYKEQSTDQNSQ